MTKQGNNMEYTALICIGIMAFVGAYFFRPSHQVPIEPAVTLSRFEALAKQMATDEDVKDIWEALRRQEEFSKAISSDLSRYADKTTAAHDLAIKALASSESPKRMIVTIDRPNRDPIPAPPKDLRKPAKRKGH